MGDQLITRETAGLGRERDCVVRGKFVWMRLPKVDFFGEGVWMILGG